MGAIWHFWRHAKNVSEREEKRNPKNVNCPYLPVKHQHTILNHRVVYYCSPQAMDSFSHQQPVMSYRTNLSHGRPEATDDLSNKMTLAALQQRALTHRLLVLPSSQDRGPTDWPIPRNVSLVHILTEILEIMDAPLESFGFAADSLHAPQVDNWSVNLSKQSFEDHFSSRTTMSPSFLAGIWWAIFLQCYSWWCVSSIHNHALPRDSTRGHFAMPFGFSCFNNCIFLLN